MTYNIIQRHKVLVNHDPQRRCYNGAYFDATLEWSTWEVLESNISEHTIDSRINFWTELNDYAVSQRGESAKSEFKKEIVNET